MTCPKGKGRGSAAGYRRPVTSAHVVPGQAEPADARQRPNSPTVAGPAAVVAPTAVAGPAGARLAPHRLIGLQRSAGNGAVAGLVGRPPQVQRDDKKTPRQRATEAAESGKPADIAALDREALQAATDTQRLQMIDVLNEQGGVLTYAQLANPWDSFHDEKGVADTNAARWKQSFKVAPSVMRASKNVIGQRVMFYRDMVHIAGDYLDVNDRYCHDEFRKLGLTDTGDVPIGPPTADQAAELQRMRDDATKLAADQEALADLRKIKVGYASVASASGGADGPPEYISGEVEFDPDRPPGHGPLQNDTHMRPWEVVKAQHDALEKLIHARLLINPTLYAVARGAHEDPAKAKTVSTGNQADALRTLGDGLKEVLANINKTRPMLTVLAPDMEPIHGQLMAGTRTADQSRNWQQSPFYATIAADMVDERKPGPWWQTVGLALAEMGAYAVAALATGGTALALGLAAKGAANVAMAQARSETLQAAHGATTTPETELITEGQVDEAKSAVIETAAFALIDAAVAGGALRGALREVMAFEKVAAESAARASAEADKQIVKQMAADAKESMAEAKNALPSVQADADAAAKAAQDAKLKAAAAGPEEASRAAVAADRAQTAATTAKNAADEVAAAAEGKYSPRAKAVTDPHGLGSKASYDATVKAAAKEIGSSWKTISPMERQTKVISVVQDRMAAQGIPAFANVRHTPGSGGASAAWWNWELTIDPALLDGTHSMESIVGLVYHEAAHFEDFINVARYQLGQGIPPAQVQAMLNLEQRGMNAALSKGAITTADAEFGRSKAIFESVWGANRGARNAIYNAKGVAKLDFELEQLRYRANNFDPTTGHPLPGRTPAMISADESILRQKFNEYLRRIEDYERLPEEQQAYGVQAGLHKSFERAALREEILKLAAVLVAAGIGAGGLYQLAERAK